MKIKSWKNIHTGAVVCEDDLIEKQIEIIENDPDWVTNKFWEDVD